MRNGAEFLTAAGHTVMTLDFYGADPDLPRITDLGLDDLTRGFAMVVSKLRERGVGTIQVIAASALGMVALRSGATIDGLGDDHHFNEDPGVAPTLFQFTSICLQAWRDNNNQGGPYFSGWRADVRVVPGMPDAEYWQRQIRLREIRAMAGLCS